MGKKIQCIGRYAMDGVTLGKGNFAHVELATHGVTEVKVAIKIIDTRKIKDEYVRHNLHREARIMASLRHPNIIRLYETLKATTLYCLVTEFAAGGELLTYIKEQKDCRLGESASRSFIRQLVSAIHYLHERRIVHRDLKMENIMLDEKKKSIKLIDFGLSNIFKEEEPLKTHCGSPEYAAPELFIVGKTYGPEVDIWSLGIIMYAMILGRLPFCTPFRDEYHRQRMLQQIQKGLSAIHDREMHTLTADCRNLLHQLIEPNPELRIPMAEVLVHPWLTKNDRCPFFPYAPPPRNKSLRNETVSELATLMDMKKGVVNETVKDHRADELSAMYNMMMDNKKKHLGICDIDHTKKAWQERNARSRSGERDKSLTPDNAKAKMSLVTRKLPTTGKKSGVGSKVKPKNRPASLATPGDGLTMPDRPLPPDRSGRNLEVIDSMGMSSRVTSPSGPLPPRDRHGQTRGGSSLYQNSDHPRSQTPAQPGGGVAAAIDPSRIPLSQRRVPPPKLSLTLDLSVTNPGVSSRHQRDDRPTSNPSTSTVSSADRKDGTISSSAAASLNPTSGTGVAALSLSSAVAAAIDCSFGIAASSGVPPRLSPKDPGKDSSSSRIPVPSSFASSSAAAAASSSMTAAGPSSTTGVRSPSPASAPSKVAGGGGILSIPKARRPSSLQYCQRASRLSVPRQSVCLPAAVPSSSRPQADAGVARGSQDVLLAPRAVPEDSLIDSCSTDDSENRFLLGTLVEALESSADTMQVDDLLKVFDDANLLQRNNIELCRDEVQELLLVRAAAAAVSSGGSGVMSAAVSSSAPVHGQHQLPSSIQSSSSSLLSKAAAGHPVPAAPPNTATVRSLDKVRAGLLIGGGEGSVASTTTMMTPRNSSSSSSCYAVEPFHSEFKSSSMVAGTGGARPLDARSLLVGRLSDLSGTSSAPRLAASQPSETDTLMAANSDHSSLSSKVTHRSLTLSISGGSSAGKLTAPKAVRGSGLSPGSPSYDERHARFSHIGAHALDVFFSPEEDESSPPGMLWRPVATRVQSSPVGELRRCPYPSRLSTASQLLQAARITTSSSSQQAPLITSLDIFTDDDEEDDDDDDDEDDDDEEMNDPGNPRKPRDCPGTTPHRRHYSVPTNHRRRPVPLPVMSASASASTSSSTTGAAAATKVPPSLEPPHPYPPSTTSEVSLRNGSSVEDVVVLGAAGASCRKSAVTGGGGAGSIWLQLPDTSSSLFQGDSRTSVVSDSNVWTSSTQMTQSCPVAAIERLLSSESSTISQDSLEWSSKVNGSPERLANRSRKVDDAVKTDAKDPVTKALSTPMTTEDSRKAKTKGKPTSTTTTTTTTPATTTTTMMTRSMFESKIPRPSAIRHRLPVIGNLLNRDRRRSNVSATSQKQPCDAQPPVKREEKRSAKSGSDSSSKAPSRVSSWRQGLTHWLQMSRTSSSTNSNNNVVRPGSLQKPFAAQPPNNTHSVTAGGGGGAAGHGVFGGAASSCAANSAPMSISLVSNHGCKSSLTIPNNYSKIHSRILDITRATKLSSETSPGATTCMSNSGQTLVLSSSSPSKKSLQGHHVHSLLDVVDSLTSVQSRRSPLARLRVRKVQWQECQKCAHSDHSSDDSTSDATGPAVADNAAPIDLVSRGGQTHLDDSSLCASVSVALNNISPNWT